MPASGAIRPSSRREQRRLAGAVGAGDADPVARVDLERDRTEREVAAPDGRLVEGRDDRARPRRGADAELQHPLLARLLDLVEPGDARLHLAHLLGLLLRRLGRGLAADLVVVGALLHRVADALRAPLALGPGPRDRGRPSCRRTRRRPRARAAGRPRAPRGRRRSRRRRPSTCCWARSSSTIRVTQRARNSRSWETSTTPAAQAAHERLEPLEAVEVEVVGRLVEQDDVEAAEQQRGQRRPRGLAAGERRHQGVGADVEAEVGQHRRRSGRRGRRHRWPSSGRSATAYASSAPGCVASRAPRRPPPSRRSPRSRRCGGRRTRATRLARDPLVLLRQPADERVARARSSTVPSMRRRGRRRGSAAAWTCRRRWRRRRRPRRRARRSGRGPRRGCGGRVRRRGPWRRASSPGPQELAEVRHREGDAAALAGVDQALLDQPVARRRQRLRLAAEVPRRRRRCATGPSSRRRRAAPSVGHRASGSRARPAWPARSGRRRSRPRARPRPPARRPRTSAAVIGERDGDVPGRPCRRPGRSRGSRRSAAYIAASASSSKVDVLARRPGAASARSAISRGSRSMR